jgi:hypothetical protein
MTAILIGAYTVLREADVVWSSIETITHIPVLLVFYLGFTFLFGFVSYLLLRQFFSLPLVPIAFTPIASAIVQEIYFRLRPYNGPYDDIGIWPYLLNIWESFVVLVGASLAYALVEIRKKRKVEPQVATEPNTETPNQAL